MNFFSLTKLGAICIALALFASGPVAQAIVVGPSAGNNTITDLYYHSSGDNYVLGDGAPINVEWAASGPYWIKNLRASADGNGTNRPVLQIGDTMTIVENLEVGGNTGWTDWHEVFSSDGWSWTEGTIVLAGANTVIDGLNVVISNGGGGDNHNDNIDFFFNELAPGTQISIIKTMVFQGLDVTYGSGAWGSDDIVIRQYPTVVIPEPATLSLLAIGGGLIGVIRRRRLKA